MPTLKCLPFSQRPSPRLGELMPTLKYLPCSESAVGRPFSTYPVVSEQHQVKSNAHPKVPTLQHQQEMPAL
jgi:hypothetical protein